MILSRRNFFLSAAIIPATSLMPGHSIVHLLKPPIRKFWSIYVDPISLITGNKYPIYWGLMFENIPESKIYRSCQVKLTNEEIDAYIKTGTHLTTFQEEYRKIRNIA